MSDIALQIERSSAGTVANGSNVVFETTVTIEGNVSYDNITGVITFNEAGRYIIGWWVATQNSLSKNGAVFELVSSQGDLLKGNSPITVGEVVGFGIIDVDLLSVPETISLINASSAPFFYSTLVPVKAALVAVKIESGSTGAAVLTGIGAPDCDIGNPDDFYIDLSSGKTYYKTTQPIAPAVRVVPPVTGNTHHVGIAQSPPFDTIQGAIDDSSTIDGDSLYLDDPTYTITATITVNKSITIEGQGPALTTIQKLVSTGGTTMINITAPYVVIKNLKALQNYPRLAAEQETVIAVNNSAATGIYLDNCEIAVSEFGLGIKAAQFQITNCSFTYAPLALFPNSYRYIAIYNTTGVSIIDSNTFVSDSGNTRCYFIAVTNVAVNSGTFQGQLLVSNNTQTAAPYTLRHLFDMEEFLGSDFQLFIIDNTTISEGNVPILLYNAKLGIFRFIQAIGNSVQNTVGKGLIGIDLSYIGTTDIYSFGNTLANPSFTAPWESATDPTSLTVGFNTAAIPTNPSLPLLECYWLPLG